MDDKNYILDASQLAVLESVKKRLYDDRKLSPDERRDLANTMDAVLHSVKMFGELD